MAAKRILLIDGRFLTAHHWSGGRVKVESEFSNEPVGLEALLAYLKKHRSSVFYVLADISEEGFQLDDLPYVQGGDRTALLKRRLEQYYYNTTLSTAISLGRASTGRRDEKILFTALTRLETFAPWLDTLREAEAILAGVYSVPLVIAGFAPKLLGESGPVLFVSLSRGGVRQTFFDNGKLHFSRLSQLATFSLDEIGRASANESAKIFQYLLAQRQIPRGTPLRTVVMAHAEQVPALQDFCRSSSELQFEFIDIGEVASKQGLKEIPGNSNADTLFIHSLAAKTPAQQFAPASETRLHKLWQVRFALTSAAWTVLAGCLLFAGKTSLNMYDLRDKTAAVQVSTAADNQRYQTILAGLPKINITPDQLRALIGRLEVLQQRTPNIQPLLVYLSQALNESPQIELTYLGWKVVDRLVESGKAQKTAQPAVGSIPAAAPISAGPWLTVEIQARLPIGLVNNQRTQLELVENFAKRLTDAKTKVIVLSRPFDIESDKPIRSADGKGPAALSEAPKFSLLVARLL